MQEHRLDRTRDHLVDGYNLMHALGVVRGRMAQRVFEVAREGFLEKLRRLWTGPGHLLVCLDGQANPAFTAAHAGQVHSRHFETRYSHKQTADDLILEMVAARDNPARLVIVSGDSDITVEARRKGCAIVGCVDWYASLTESPPAPRENLPLDEKPTGQLSGTGELVDLWGPDVERQQERGPEAPKPAVRQPKGDSMDAMVRQARALAEAHSPPPAPPQAAPACEPAAPRPRPPGSSLEAMLEGAREFLRRAEGEATAPRSDAPRPLKGGVDPGKPVGDIGGMGVPDDLIRECRRIIGEEGGGASRSQSGGL